MPLEPPTTTSDVKAAAVCYVEQFGLVLSTRFVNSESPSKASAIVRETWRSAVTKTESEKPVLFIIGCGHGTPIRCALAGLHPPLLNNNVSCVYDTSSLSMSRVNDLINECHSRAFKTVVTYINCSLQSTAQSFIQESVASGMIPSANEFAISHFNAFNTFIALLSRYSRKSSLFAATIIDLEGGLVHSHNSLRAFKKRDVTITSAETVFLSTWKELQRHPANEIMANAFKVRPSKPPKKIRNLSQAALRTTHFLAANLKTNLSVLRKPRTTMRPPNETRAAPQDAPRPASKPPSQTLVHAPVFGSISTVETVTGVQETTTRGQEQLLEDERPARLVVRERQTHEHEMETVIVR